MIFREPNSCLRQVAPDLGLTHQSNDCRLQTRNVARLNQHYSTTLGRHFRNSSDAPSHDGNTHGKAFHQNVRTPIQPRADDHNVAARQTVDGLSKSEDMNPVAQLLLVDPSLERG